MAFGSITASAQSADTLAVREFEDWRTVYERMFAMEAGEDGEGIDEDVMEHLDGIAMNPFNINAITQEQLKELPFLSDEEINAIGFYIYRYGAMMTLQELQAIPQISYGKRQLLRFFLYCGEKPKRDSFTWKNIAKYGRHDIYYGGHIPLYERRGDALPPEKGGYLGVPYKHQFRYTFSYGQNLKVGIVGANDSGEQFFAGRNSAGYDFYSFYAQLKNRPLTGSISLDNLIVGRYRAAFGMGLVVNNNFSLGKTTMMSSAGRISTGFRPLSSASDANYFQGAACTIAFGNGNREYHGNGGFRGSRHLRLSLFASTRKIHATVSADTISTIINSGYHRSANEMRKKNAASASALGANLQLTQGKLSLGATAAATYLSKPLMPDKRQAFRRFYPEGKSFYNASLNYAYNGRKTAIQGETAVSDSGAVAMVNSLTYHPVYGFKTTLLHRYYAHNYNALNARSFSENTTIQDEHGIFGGVSWSITRSLSLDYYADYAYFSKPKYLVSFPSHAVENMLLATWHKKEWTVSLRGRLKNREYDNTDKTALVWKNTASVRLQGEYNAVSDGLVKDTKLMELRTKLILQYSHYDKADTKSDGILALFDGGLQPWRRLSLNLSAGYFNTDDYYSAIYAYEHGMNYSMNYMQLYGEGIRCAVILRSAISKNISAALKIGSTKYFDRKLIGSGLDEIQGNLKSDIDFQVKWRL